MQDVYRWTYEVEKIDVANHRIGLRRVTADSLQPYPAPWISPGVHKRIFLTSLLRSIAGPERAEYFHVWSRSRKEARIWARRVNQSYLAFQTYWPGMMSALWNNEPLADSIVNTGTPQVARRRKKRRRDEYDESERDTW
jgi:hypothetical protein